MYNRYIPQPDGSYRRSSIQEVSPPRKPEPPKQAPPPPPPEYPPSSPVQPPPPRCRNCPVQKPPQKRSEPTGTGVLSFLKQLLPGDFDTGDLLVVILLLLMSADSNDDQSSALLTLALYLFL